MHIWVVYFLLCFNFVACLLYLHLLAELHSICINKNGVTRNNSVIFHISNWGNSLVLHEQYSDCCIESLIIPIFYKRVQNENFLAVANKSCVCGRNMFITTHEILLIATELCVFHIDQASSMHWIFPELLIIEKC